ncbi:hypothetical protein Tco_0024502 [Tanacetum coccineum]
MHVTADDDDAFDLRASLDIKSVGKALVGSADFEALFLDLIRNVNDEFDACIVISFFLLAERLLKRSVALKEVVKKVLSLQSLSSPTESLLYLEVEASLFLNVVGIEASKVLLARGRQAMVCLASRPYFAADQGVEGVVAVAGDALKVFTM